MKLEFSNFLKGIMSLLVSQVLVKIFGVIYTLYITNKNGFGDSGNAIYMSGYQIYALLLTISSIGVPNAISKLISEKRAIKDYKNEKRIFLVSIMLFSILGFFGAMILFFGANIISDKILIIPDAKLSIQVLSPAVFFVSITSVIRGYFNGRQKIEITAFSQFIEQCLKSVLTIIFVEIVDKLSYNNTKAMAAAANFATTVATLASMSIIINKYIKINHNEKNVYEYKIERISKIIKNILIISIPITLTAIVSSMGKNIDSITIVRILKDSIGENKAIEKYGILSSKVDVLISLPLSFNLAISTALIPEISRLKSQNDISEIVKKINFSLIISILLGIPCVFGLYFYAKPIFELLFPRALEGSELLKVSSISVIFLILSQTINGILQGIGKNNIPLIASFIGIIAKILCNILLIPIKDISENGAVIGNVISSIISFIIAFYVLRKNIKFNFKFIFIVGKAIIFSIIMINISYKIYNLLLKLNINKSVCTINSILSAVIIYIILIFLTKILEKIKNRKTLARSHF